MLMLEAMIDMGGNLKTIILDGCEVSIKTEPEPKLTTHHRPGEILLKGGLKLKQPHTFFVEQKLLRMVTLSMIEI